MRTATLPISTAPVRTAIAAARLAFDRGEVELAAAGDADRTLHLLRDLEAAASRVAIEVAGCRRAIISQRRAASPATNPETRP